MKNVLLPVDFSANTEVGLEVAAQVARSFGASVRLLHVAPPDPAFAHSRSWPQEVRDEMAKELKQEHDQIRELANRLEAEGIQTKSVVTRGPIADTIVHYAEEVESDLIILPAKKEGAMAQFLPRSVVKSVLKKAPCSILVVPVSNAKPNE